MLVLNSISFDFGGRYLYSDAFWHIKPNQKIGLVGANGTGKSTLLRIIHGEYSLTGGEITGRRDLTIGFLNQDLLSYESDKSILDVALEVFERENILHEKIEKILKQLETEHGEDLLNELYFLQSEFESLDGYNITHRAEAILEGLGFSTEDLQRPLKEFSGGWRMRVMLARMLLKKPDLLMLDEPTNHLDLPSIQWLEKYLQDYDGTFILVSHDRYFLDRTVNTIAEIANEKITIYTGNFSDYLEQKTLRDELQQRQYDNQEKYIKEQQKLIDRFRAKASKAKMAQSRMKMLDRMEKVESVAGPSATMRISLNIDSQPGKVIYEGHHITKKYGEMEIFNNSHFQIERGDKIALIGANGKGKSTLLKIIAGTETADGELKEGYNVKTSFYAQHQLESLNINNDLMTELQVFAPLETDQRIRSILGAFLFNKDDVFKKIKVLSGGEKARVALGKLILSKANFLLLDEPTNHLDMQSVEILTDVLQNYDGTFVVVSHDRFFVEQIANKIWFIENHQLKEYPGTYEEYEHWAQRKLQEKKAEEKTAVKKPVKEKKETNNEDAKKQADLLEKQVKKLEAELNIARKKKDDLLEQLGMEENYNDKEKSKKLQAAYEQSEKELNELHSKWEDSYMQWMELSE
ncbi:MAG: ABC-F family ATP-binding cassette domain-containing protein [Bacteroidetes bacterium]|jgi:ATP-binding cassette subfamily F protein 3|nr:ABC-F family ATP-binding cassette domain-containing protein [Bacteroidota bacterium]